MDYVFLRNEGIRHLERLAGQLWTDFNTHDPGITILEQLCYAISDLGYRIEHEIPDLLAEGGRDSARGLFSAAEILTSHPVTLTDLRKLVLDVEGVKNAWVESVKDPGLQLRYHTGKQELGMVAQPPETEEVRLKGLLRVLIEKSDLVDADSDVLKREVARRLHAHRSLGQDFAEIQVLQPENITVAARVEVGVVQNAEDLLQKIYQRIAEFLSPTVRFQTLQELLDQGRLADEIFDGPRLTHGFLDSASLAKRPRRKAVRTSDLIREIMSVSGVRAVRHIRLARTSDLIGLAPEQRCDTASNSKELWEDWYLALGSDRTPQLDLTQPCIRLQKGQIEVSVDVQRVVERYYARQRAERAGSGLDREAYNFSVPKGRDRHIGNYHSIQHQFPALYGVGENELSAQAAPLRRAQSKQLKAYLLFFDQLLANYFAQLAHTGDLLSFHARGIQTYFAGEIDDAHLSLEPIRGDAKAHREWLHENAEGGGRSGNAVQRKQRFLDHLLARFAEVFTDYSLVLYDGALEREQDPRVRLASAKQAFLQRYPRISAARGTACNSLEPPGVENISGLEERIRLKLGLVEADEKFYLIEHILLRPIADDQQQDLPILAATPLKDPYSLQLTFVFPDWPERFQDPKFRDLARQTIREETPAHLIAYVRWLTPEEMQMFKETYAEWFERRRERLLASAADMLPGV